MSCCQSLLAPFSTCADAHPIIGVSNGTPSVCHCVVYAYKYAYRYHATGQTCMEMPNSASNSSFTQPEFPHSIEKR